MIETWITCNGCGCALDLGGEKINIITIDMTNYVAFSTGFIMKNPKLDLHFCNECYSKIKDGSVDVRNLGDTHVMAREIKNLKIENGNIQDEFDSYKAMVSSLIEPAYRAAIKATLENAKQITEDAQTEGSE